LKHCPVFKFKGSSTNDDGLSLLFDPEQLIKNSIGRTNNLAAFFCMIVFCHNSEPKQNTTFRISIV
jgi:hypothetical protein